MTENRTVFSRGRIPERIEKIPAGYKRPAGQQGTLEKLTYSTWEAFSYEQHTKKIGKEAWVYLPYGYTPEQSYNVFYISHGGWSNETTVMGTARHPNAFKNVIDHAIEDGRMQPMILVMLTYNNFHGKDSWDYSLAIKLTDRYHNELVHDLLPAVEGRYSTYARSTSEEDLRAARDHRGFAGFSMGSVNTWCTFRYALDYFRYFMPMSGNYTTDGSAMAEMVSRQGHSPDDFFIYAMSGPDDFAYPAFRAQIDAMVKVRSTFRMADSEADGNLAFREMAGYPHGEEASELYTYNGLQFFWSPAGADGRRW